MSVLIGLPHELLHRVCREVDPRDVGRLARTCRSLHRFIDGNELLFKHVYLNHFDCPERDDVDWKAELTSVVRVLQLLESDGVDVKTENVVEVTRIVERMLTKVSPWYGKGQTPTNLALLQDHFRREKNKKAFLCRSTLMGRARAVQDIVDAPLIERQASAKLHCLFGKHIDATAHLRSEDYPVITNALARAKVYDLREYTEDTFWGPFVNDGSGDVDWEKVESVMIDLNYNMEVFGARTGGLFVSPWSKPFGGLSKDSFRPKHMLPQGLSPSVDMQDPYNVNGSWFRIVCFLDYGDLYEFNFGTEQPAPSQPRQPLDTEEAIRLIKMELEVCEICEPGETDGKELPVVLFKGHSTSLHASWDPNANSDIRGSVRLTPEGYIRWTTFSVYHGEERWRSEGIQLGGIRSSRGILGHWFDKDYSTRGPAGPTAFWKISNECDDRRGPPKAR